MTRHKQEEHGHPRRGERAPSSKRVTHSVITLSNTGAPAVKGKNRSNKESRRSKPYTIPRKHSLRLSETPSTSLSFSSPSAPPPPFSPSPALSTLTSSSFQNPILGVACPALPSFALPEASLDTPLANVDDLYIPDYLHWPAEPSDLDSLFRLSLLPRSENPYHEPQGLSEYTASLPDVFFPEQVHPSNIAQPIFPDVPRYTSPFNHDALLPTGVNHFQNDACNLENDYPLGNYPFPSQSDTFSTPDLWGSLSSEEQLELIWEHLQYLELSSLAPASAFPDDRQKPLYESNLDWDPLSQWLATPFQSLTDSPEMVQQDVNGSTFFQQDNI